MNSMKKKSDSYYDKAWRWIEDTYLKYFGENRTSYGVKGSFNSLFSSGYRVMLTFKDTLKKGEVSGNEDIDGVQRQVGDTVGDQFGKGGVGESVGTHVDKGLLRGNV